MHVLDVEDRRRGVRPHVASIPRGRHRYCHSRPISVARILDKSSGFQCHRISGTSRPGPLALSSRNPRFPLIFSWRPPVGAPVSRSGGLPNRFWQRSLREHTIPTPTVEFTVAPRRRLPRRPRPAPLGASNSSPDACIAPTLPSHWTSPPVCWRSITPPGAVGDSWGCTLAVSPGTRSVPRPPRIPTTRSSAPVRVRRFAPRGKPQ